MIGEVILVTICSAGVVFLLYFLIAIWREDRACVPNRILKQGVIPVVVQLPTDPIFTAAAIRPAAIPEETPFTLISNANRPAAAFYVGGYEREPEHEKYWQLFVNPKASRLKRAR